MIEDRLAFKIAKNILRWNIKPLCPEPDILENVISKDVPPPEEGTTRRIFFDSQNRRVTSFYNPEQLDEIVYSEIELKYNSFF